MYVFFLFLFGLFLGSFLGVIVDRVSLGKSFLLGRSKCDFCNRVLGITDLIPVLSFFLLKRKCRYCKHSLSWYYPTIEILTGLLYAASYMVIGSLFSFEYILLMTILSLLLCIFFADIKYGIIPNTMVLLLFILVGLYHIHVFNVQVYMYTSYLLSGFSAFLFFLLLYFLTRGKGMGFGDIKLVFVLGFFLGYPRVIFALYIAFLTGALVSLILVLARKKKFKGGTVPFGPFLIIGTYISLFWGEILIRFFPYL